MKLPLTLIILLIGFISQAQDVATSSDAFKISEEKHKPVLIVFSGSDWWAPCIHFDKKILKDERFQTFAKDNLVMLRADFPQRKKLSDQIKKQNDALAEQYNPKGVFPYLVLVSPGRSKSTVLNYSDENPEEFISLINAQMPQ